MVIVKIGIDTDTLRSTFESNKHSHRIRSIASYGNGSSPKFALVMHPGSGEHQQVLPDLSEEAVHDIVDGSVVGGRVPTHLVCTKSYPFRYTLVMEYREYARPMRVVTHRTLDEFFGKGAVKGIVATIDEGNGHLVWLDTFQGIDTEFMCAIFDEAPPVRETWAVTRTDLWPNETLTGVGVLESMRLVWARPEALIPVPHKGGAHIFGWWRDDVYVPLALTPNSFDTGVFSAEMVPEEWVESFVGAFVQGGAIPLTICAGGPSDNTMFGIVFTGEPRYAPLPRKFRISEALDATGALANTAPALMQMAVFADELDASERTEIHPSALHPDENERRRAKRAQTLLSSEPDGSRTRQAVLANSWGRGDQDPSRTSHPVDPQRYRGPAPRLWTGIDDAMRVAMQRSATRGSQISIARDGQLKFARSYTWAEDGYPKLTLQNMLRIGSISKCLTSIGLMKGFGPETPSRTGFATSLSKALGIEQESPQREMLDVLTLEHLLRHRTGWGYSGETFRSEEVLPDIADATTMPHPAWLPGDYREYLNVTSDALLLDVPGAVAKYNNANYRVLGDVVSARQFPSIYSAYETTMFGHLGLPIDGSLGHVQRVTWDQAMNEMEASVHLRYPGPSVKDDVPLSALYFDARAHAGSGFWCISMNELCRIIAGLDLRAARPTLTRKERDAVTQPWLFEIPGTGGNPPSSVLDTGARGFGLRGDEFLFRGATGTSVQVLEFLGMDPGGTCYIRHYSRFVNGEVVDTLTVTMAFASDAFINYDPIFQAIQDHELDEGWPDGDAFG